MKILIKCCCRLMVFFVLVMCFNFELYARTYDLSESSLEIKYLDDKETVYSYSKKLLTEDNDPIITANENEEGDCSIAVCTKRGTTIIIFTMKDLNFKSLSSSKFLHVAADACIYLDGNNKLEKSNSSDVFYIGPDQIVVMKPVGGGVGKLELKHTNREYAALKIENGSKLKVEGSTQLSIYGNVEGKDRLDTTGLSQDGFVRYLDENDQVVSIEWGTVDEHIWDEGKITTEPKCTTKGIKAYTCTAVPEHTKTEEIECLGHTYADASDPENWKKNETSHWQECAYAATTCSDMPDSIKTMGEHVYESNDSRFCEICGYDRTHKHTLTYVEVAEPTCTEAGNKAYYKCTECDTMYKDAFGIVCIEAKDVYLQPTGHKLEKHASVSATCTQDGNIEYYVCETCGNFYKDAEGLLQIEGKSETIIPATGHVAGDSYQSNGTKHWQTCDICKAPLGEAEHSAVGCQFDGTNHWKVCETCGKIFDVTEHNFSEGNCTVCGYTREAAESDGYRQSNIYAVRHSGGGAGSTGTMKAVTSSGTQGSWVHDEKGWWFRKTDGTYPKSGWTKLTWQGNSYWYYFNADGYMDMGWLDWNSKRYYLNPMIGTNSGRMFTGWQQIDGKWYYFSTEQDANEGSLLRSVTTPDGYRVDADGIWQQN